MGLSWSKPHRALRKEAFYRALRENDVLMQQLKDVGLEQKQLHELFRIFSAMDKDRSGEINMMEFFTYIGEALALEPSMRPPQSTLTLEHMTDLARNRFSEKAFAVMDKDGSGEVDFLEFVLAVWNYCSFTHSSLVRFAFDLYDLDSSGEIERAEAVQCVREIWGSEWESSSTAQKVLAKLESIMESTTRGRLSVTLFQDFAMRHPMLLFPAFQLQTEIQQKVLGQRFWTQAAKRRGTLDPSDFHWGKLEQVAQLSRDNSRRLLNAIEADLGEQLGEHLRPKKMRSVQSVKSLKRSSNSFSGSSSVAAGFGQSGRAPTDATATTAVVEVVEPLRPTQRQRAAKAPSRSTAAQSGLLVVEEIG